MNRRVTIFMIVLLLLLVGYLYASNKMVIYNHSVNEIQKIVVDAEFRHKELVNIKPDAELRFTFFSPFNKTVSIKVVESNQIRSTTFQLEGFGLGEQYNQVEIDTTAIIKKGALGLE